ncbi:MAG TPA: septum formation initiator family protein [Marmoricola sp.]
MSGPRRSPQTRRPDRSGRPAGGRTRPGERATARIPVAAPTATARRTRFTNRMFVFVLVLAVLVISYASSMRAYLRQSGEMNDLKAQIASAQKSIASMKAEKHRWQDPAYVEEQARLRFGWVVAGETGYQVIGRDGKRLAGTGELSTPTQHLPAPTAWWSTQYDSLRAADHPEVKHKAPTPLKKITPDSKDDTSGG